MSHMYPPTTVKHHQSGPETQFSSSPGEGRGHQLDGTPGRQGESYSGKDVPVKPFEGGLEAESSPPVVDDTNDAIVNKLQLLPKFPINLVVDKDGTCNVKRVYTVGRNMREIEGKITVKCTDEGVDVMIPEDKEDMIAAIEWAIRDPMFWYSVLYRISGLPVSEDCLHALEKEGKESKIPALSVLKTREAHPEFLPCREWSSNVLKRKLLEFWPTAASQYPEPARKVFAMHDIAVLQTAVTKDLFYLMLQNPVMWMPIRHDQITELVEEFSTAGTMLQSLAARYEVQADFNATDCGSDNDFREMQALPEEVLSDIQLAERERSAAESSDESTSVFGEKLVEPCIPEGGYALEFRDDDEKKSPSNDNAADSILRKEEFEDNNVMRNYAVLEEHRGPDAALEDGSSNLFAPNTSPLKPLAFCEMRDSERLDGEQSEEESDCDSLSTVSESDFSSSDSESLHGRKSDFLASALETIKMIEDSYFEEIDLNEGAYSDEDLDELELSPESAHGVPLRRTENEEPKCKRNFIRWLKSGFIGKTVPEADDFLGRDAKQNQPRRKFSWLLNRTDNSGKTGFRNKLVKWREKRRAKREEKRTTKEEKQQAENREAKGNFKNDGDKDNSDSDDNDAIGFHCPTMRMSGNKRDQKEQEKMKRRRIDYKDDKDRIYPGECLHDDDDNATPTPNAASCNSSDTSDSSDSEEESVHTIYCRKDCRHVREKKLADENKSLLQRLVKGIRIFFSFEEDNDKRIRENTRRFRTMA